MRTFIIAEAGVNHNGSLKIAKKLIDEVLNSGADAIKFQTFRTKDVVTSYAKKASYQSKNSSYGSNQFEMIKKLELSEKDHKVLINYCKRKKLKFLSSPFDIPSIEFLKKTGLDIFKIPSGEITNLPFLEKIGSCKRKIILSTGMSTMQEISDALTVLIKSGTKRKNIVVLHCNSEYPTPFSDVNLNAMSSIRKKFKVKVGYSDHTLGIEVPVAAVALGAEVIEKHFTLDRNMTGPDHKASIEPEEFKLMVESIRNIERALGNGVKKPSASEIKNIKIVRKSIVAKTNIKKGDIFSVKNLTVKRPGVGISPMEWYKVLGKNSGKNFKSDELIRL